MSVLFEGIMAPQGLMKDTKPLQEALIFCELQRLPKKQLKEFLHSEGAKYLIENDIISGDTLDRLANEEFTDRAVILTVQHMAKENEDERWNELVRHRAEERRLMNELIGEYGDDARTYAESYREDFIKKHIPKSYLAE